MPRLTILVPDMRPADEGAFERALAGPDFSWHFFGEKDPERVPATLWRSADAVLAWHAMPIERSTIERMDRCRLLVRCGVGYDRVDLEAAGRAGIPTCNVPDYGTREVADHTMALLLALCRGVVAWHQGVVANPVAAWHADTPPPVRRLAGLRLGIVGLGRIGTAVALRAKAFGIELFVFDPYLPYGQDLAVGAARMEDLTDFLAEVDVVSIHAPLTEETEAMFDAAALRAMRRGSVLINTARGGIVDLDALAEVLENGHLGAAALDVLPQEPPQAGHRLLTALREDAPWLRGRLILTPHKAWKCAASLDDLRRKSVETALAYLLHGRLRNCVNGAFLKHPRPAVSDSASSARSA